MQKHVDLKYRKVKTYKKLLSSVEGLLMVNEGKGTIFSECLCQQPACSIGLVTVFDAILTSRQTGLK